MSRAEPPRLLAAGRAVSAAREDRHRPAVVRASDERATHRELDLLGLVLAARLAAIAGPAPDLSGYDGLIGRER